MNLLDRAIRAISPGWHAKRELARFRADAISAYYDGATIGRRGASIRRSAADANVITAATLPRLRAGARDLARNNPWALSAVEAIVAETVGTGIDPQFMRNGERALDIEELERRHLDTTACDAAGKLNYHGLVSLAFRTIVESGEVIIRRRWRRLSDGLPVPIQFQVLEPDYLDISKDGPTPTGGRIVQGVEFDAIGRVRAYWLFPEHPGGRYGTGQSQPVPARDIIHAYDVKRPEQVRGIPWLSSVMLRLADFADYEEAQLVRQKIAACFAVFVREAVGSGLPASVRQEGDQLIDRLEPGIVERIPFDAEISFAQPPGVEGYDEYAAVSLRAIASAMGISYTTLTGDLTRVNFSAGRLGWLREQRNIARWQRHIVIPQICEPLCRWFLEAAAMIGVDTEGVTVQHIPPRREMIDPTKEVPAEREAILSGQKTLTQVIRERGRDPVEHLREYAADLALLDELGLSGLTSDPRTRALGVGRSAPADTESAREAA